MSPEKNQMGKALDVVIQLLGIGVIVLGSLLIFSPFMIPVIWALVLAVTFHPLYEKIKQLLGGRKKLAGSLFIVVTLALILAPTVFLADSLLDATVRLVKEARDGTLVIPPPTESVRDWPVVGERAYAIWNGASVDLQATAAKLQPQLRNVGEAIIRQVGGLGRSLLETVLAIVIAGILMITSEGGARAARSVARRLSGEKGAGIVDLTVSTIRSVVKGVVLVALCQALLAAAGLLIAGVPGAGLWSLLVLIVAVMQLPPLLVLGPIIPWVFANNDSTAIQIFYTIWCVVVSASDGVLKPLLLGRGVQVPMLVILIGAIGGMLRAGVIGLFIGPVILSIFHNLFIAWVNQDAKPES
jgi:predicted PurR-regulated permease PerM